MALVISGATVIDGIAESPIHGRLIWIEGERIKAIGTRDELVIPSNARVIDARGKFVIPGLMNANVHLLADIRLETIARFMDRHEALIEEAAQIALKNGVTTVFDTWGPRRFLVAARDSINAARTPGSRIFCAGNIIGLDGPYSQEFIAQTCDVASAGLVNKINAIWVENVGRHLMWRTREEVAREVRTYIAKGIDFVKYASNGHGGAFGSAFLAFSPQVQAAIVEEAHRAGLTAQAHTMTVEGLRLAIEAGCDIIQHINITGPVPIPETTLQLIAERQIAAVIFPFTQRRLDTIMEHASDADQTLWKASDINARNLIRSGAPLLAATDGFLWGPGDATDSFFKRVHLAPDEDNLFDLGRGHFAWFRAMEEKGCPPMEMLRAATRNIAVAYGKDKDLGTLEPGKIADMLLLDRNPLEAAENYRSICMILKGGEIVDGKALPVNSILTKPMERAEEEGCYVPFVSSARSPMFPMCPICMRG